MIEIIENPSDETLDLIVRQSKFVVFPSLAEGYGLGIVEGILHNKPVICNDMPVFREASQGLALFAKTNDTQEWLRCFTHLTDSRINFDQALRKLRQFKFRSWDDYFDDLCKQIFNKT